MVKLDAITGGRVIKRLKQFIALFTAIVISNFVPAEEIPFERGLVLIRNELQIAGTGIRALNVAAHPDDEDGGTLSYLRRQLGVETHLVLSTRGEGGQNEAGTELGPDLAVRRTQESEESAKILGTKIWYLNLPDFGFSKSPDEALKVWGHDKALAQMVRVIRLVRPQIIFTNHDPEGKDHGHHVATAKLLVEAFDAAADPQKFPEQMKEDGTQPWAASKLYLRRFSPQQATLTIDLSKRDPISGLSDSEIAAFALTKHLSQGMQRQLKPGEREMRYFMLLKTKKPDVKDESLISGLDLEAQPAVRDAVNAALKNCDAEKLANGSLQKTIATAFSSSEKDEYSKAHLARAFAEALGIKLQLRADDALTTFDEKDPFTLRIANTGANAVQLKGWKLLGESALWNTEVESAEKEIAAGDAIEFKGSAIAKAGAFPTFPRSQYIFSRIEERSPVQALVTLRALDAELKFTLNAPVDLAEPRNISISPDPVLIFDDSDHDDNFKVLTKFRMVVTNRQKISEPLKLFAGIVLQNGAPVDRFATLKFREEDETHAEEFRFMADVAELNKGDVMVPTSVWTAQQNLGQVNARLRRVPIKLPPTLNVGLVRTYDDATLNALRALEGAGLGLTVSLLSPDDLRAGDLNKFHTIILDIRATQYRPEVRQVRERLMQFMNDGGCVLCMYHKDFDWNVPDKDQSLRGQGFFRGKSGGGEIAPYPIELSFDRVTQEDAPVRLLNPEHPLLSWPNKIWEKDFAGWVQERGVYFPKKWAPEYTTLLASNDPNEPPLDGGLLVAKVGEGSFIYTSYVWYRQLRTGNPGAYRMLANMISYARAKKEMKK